MIKMYQYLQNLFGRRILSNDDIPRYLKVLAQQGVFDQPKQLAVITELCLRIAQLEKQAEYPLMAPSAFDSAMGGGGGGVFNIDKKYSLEKPAIAVQTGTHTLTLKNKTTAPPTLSWFKLRATARTLPGFRTNMKKAEVEALLASQ